MQDEKGHRPTHESPKPPQLPQRDPDDIPCSIPQDRGTQKDVEVLISPDPWPKPWDDNPDPGDHDNG